MANRDPAFPLKVFAVVVTVVTTALVVAAAIGFQPQNEHAVDDSGLYVFTDPDTGCEYLSRTSLTPRIAEDGTTHKGCRNG